MVIAAMELDADGTRAAAADYSDPYYTDEAPLVVVKKENADQVCLPGGLQRQDRGRPDRYHQGRPHLRRGRCDDWRQPPAAGFCA